MRAHLTPVRLMRWPRTEQMSFEILPCRPPADPNDVDCYDRSWIRAHLARPDLKVESSSSGCLSDASTPYLLDITEVAFDRNWVKTLQHKTSRRF